MSAAPPDRLVDPHHHLWDPRALRYGRTLSPPSYLLPDFLADAAGVDLARSVHLQAEVERGFSVAETRWLQELADRHGFPHGIVAYANLAEPGLDRTLEEHARAPNLRGIRQILNWDPDPRLSQCERPDYLTDPAWLAGYGRLTRYRLSFDLQVFPWQMADAARVAAAHPETSMIVNHAGMPRVAEEHGWEDWSHGMQALSRQPNVFVKLSGFGMFDAGWTASLVRPYVLGAIEMFGVERCMFASNYPVDRPARAYGEMFSTFASLVAGCSEAERRALFHDNALRLYRLQP
jgi:predicted TIM-barrel fold metal-dependent hydrolase